MTSFLSFLRVRKNTTPALRSIVMLAGALLVLPASAFAAAGTGQTAGWFKDGTQALNGSMTSVISTSSSQGTRAVFGKVLITSSATSIRWVKCVLEVIDAQTVSVVSSDWSTVTLAAGSAAIPSEATLAFQAWQITATGAPNHNFFHRISCQVTSMANTGVSVAWRKLTAIYQDDVAGSVSANPGL